MPLSAPFPALLPWQIPLWQTSACWATTEDLVMVAVVLDVSLIQLLEMREPEVIVPLLQDGISG